MEVLCVKKMLIILTVILSSIISVACAADEIPEEAINQLKEHCYVNPDGGSKLHSDRNCKSVNPKYLPLTEIEFDEALLIQYSICPICTTPDQPEEETSLLDRATMVMPEEEIYRITVEWEKQYGFSGLWDYQVNAAFAAENGTIPYTAYIFNPSLLPVFPDEDAIPAEKIADEAVALAASYGSRLTENDLGNMQVIVSEYLKPDKDISLFSTAGTWLVKFMDDADTIAWLYVNARTGIPDFFYIIPDAVTYTGEPGVAAVTIESE